ncbi:hypothetical protein PIB30_025624 [Stylosanthes scabra]|uniref:Uncharacterized protein n=1 Tax=Stylosanthes scabra TaxID=79078 RepID=A0ABU6U919_9FABA|nr:hypothetical protein [Stylosanthes scabra]
MPKKIIMLLLQLTLLLALLVNLPPTFLMICDSESQDKDVNPAPVPTATRDIFPKSDARDTASVVGTAIEDEGVEEEGTQTDNTLEHTQDGDSDIVYASCNTPIFDTVHNAYDWNATFPNLKISKL